MPLSPSPHTLRKHKGRTSSYCSLKPVYTAWRGAPLDHMAGCSPYHTGVYCPRSRGGVLLTMVWKSMVLRSTGLPRRTVLIQLWTHQEEDRTGSHPSRWQRTPQPASKCWLWSVPSESLNHLIDEFSSSSIQMKGVCWNESNVHGRRYVPNATWNRTCQPGRK